jgi:hypothetical protein
LSECCQDSDDDNDDERHKEEKNGFHVCTGFLLNRLKKIDVVGWWRRSHGGSQSHMKWIRSPFFAEGSTTE